MPEQRRRHTHRCPWRDFPRTVFNNAVRGNPESARRDPVREAKAFLDDGSEVGQAFEIVEIGCVAGGRFETIESRAELREDTRAGA